MKKTFFYTYLLLSFLLGSCKKNENTESTKISNSTNTTETTNNTISNTVSAKNIRIQYQGNLWATLTMEGEKAVIVYENKNILVHKRKDDKRKYETDGVIIKEIKYKEDGFKLRTPEGNLLWKVKLDDNKIKISNNEENKNPFELKMHESGKAKIKLNDTEIAESKLKNNKIAVESKGKVFEIENQTFDKAYTILGIEEILPQDRLIILVELLENK
jgi:uncharacterized protein YkuJ